jgi:IS30 family transposase
MKYRRMDYIDRINLEDALKQGKSQRWIARRLRFHPSTVCREINRNRATPRSSYWSGHAERLTWQRWGWRRQPRKLKGDLRAWVIRMLQGKWSPEQICCRLRDETGQSLSPETVYRMVERDRKTVHTQGLWRHLRQARKARRRRCVLWNRSGKRQNLPTISSRGRFADLRLQKGHWERDTMLGQKTKCALLVMVDRKSRYTRIGFLRRRTTEETSLMTMKLLKGLSCKTITSDRGSEFIDYEHLEQAIGAKIYFCNPYTASERGTNENTIGLIRQYFPKGRDLSNVTVQQIAEVERQINNRPRKCLDFKTPHEVFFRKTVALCA